MASIAASTSAAMVTPSADTNVSNGVYVPGGITNGDVKPAVSTTPLADFLMQLEEYTPTVSQVLSGTDFTHRDTQKTTLSLDSTCDLHLIK